jgi:hypothetical protein
VSEAKRNERVVIILNGNVIHPPDGYVYKGRCRNRYLPDKSEHLWMSGYYCWRPPKQARIIQR